MDPREKERLAEDAPKRYHDEREGQKVMASFGGTLTLAALAMLVVIALVWWLTMR